MIYLIVSIIVLSVSIKLFKFNIGSLALSKLNMISWIFYIDLFLCSYVGSLLVVNGIDNHYLISKVSSDSRFYGWLSVQYSIIAIPVGMLLMNAIFGYRSVSGMYTNYCNKCIYTSVSRKDSYIRFFLYFLSCITVLATLYTFSKLQNIPIISLIKGESSIFLATLRQEATRQFLGNEYIRNIFAISLSPILTYISYSYYKLTNDKYDKYWFIVLFINSFFILTYNLAKAPFIIFIIGFFIHKILITGSISKQKLFILFLIVFILISFAYFTVMGKFGLELFTVYNSGVLGRILLSQAAGTYLSFEYFPSKHDYLGFSSFSRYLSYFFNMNYSDRSSRIIMSYANPVGYESGSAGVINSLFVAEAWCNWGWLGIIVSPLMVGMIIQLFFIFFLKSKKTPIMLGLFSFISIRMPLTGGINDFFYNAGYTVIVFVFLLIFIFALVLKQYRRLTYENNFSSSTSIGQ